MRNGRRLAARRRRPVFGEPDPRPGEAGQQQRHWDQHQVKTVKTEQFQQHAAQQRPGRVTEEAGEHENGSGDRRRHAPRINRADAAQPFGMNQCHTDTEHQHDQRQKPHCSRSGRHQSDQADRTAEHQPDLNQQRPGRGFAECAGPELHAVGTEGAEGQQQCAGADGEGVFFQQARQESRQHAGEHIDSEMDRGQHGELPDRKGSAIHSGSDFPVVISLIYPPAAQVSRNPRKNVRFLISVRIAAGKPARTLLNAAQFHRTVQ